ncbi:MAG: hypothetical protein AB7V18_12240 [Pyrinomonadaceae bacterium]
MLADDLRFVRQIDGKKPHYIFEQGDEHYVFTLLDDDKRGNFFVISSTELDETKRSIQKEHLHHREFHPKDIKLLRWMDKDYRISRLRSICYVLTARGFLGQIPAGRELHFFITQKFAEEIQTKSNSTEEPRAREKESTRQTGKKAKQQKFSEPSKPDRRVSKEEGIRKTEARDEYCPRCKSLILQNQNKSAHICLPTPVKRHSKKRSN